MRVLNTDKKERAQQVVQEICAMGGRGGCTCSLGAAGPASAAQTKGSCRRVRRQRIVRHENEIGDNSGHRTAVS